MNTKSTIKIIHTLLLIVCCFLLSSCLKIPNLCTKQPEEIRLLNTLKKESDTELKATIQVPLLYRTKKFETHEDRLYRFRKQPEKVLYLPKLKTITEQQAHAISKFEGILYLNEVESISDPISDVLFQCACSEVYLDGLTTITPHLIHKLMGNSHIKVLSLNGIQKMNAEEFQELMRFQGRELSIDGLSSLNPEQIEMLDMFHGDIIRLHNVYASPSKKLPMERPHTTSFQEIHILGLDQYEDKAATALYINLSFVTPILPDSEDFISIRYMNPQKINHIFHQQPPVKVRNGKVMIPSVMVTQQGFSMPTYVLVVIHDEDSKVSLESLKKYRGKEKLIMVSKRNLKEKNPDIPAIFSAW